MLTFYLAASFAMLVWIVFHCPPRGAVEYVTAAAIVAFWPAFVVYALLPGSRK